MHVPGAKPTAEDQAAQLQQEMEELKEAIGRTVHTPAEYTEADEPVQPPYTDEYSFQFNAYWCEQWQAQALMDSIIRNAEGLGISVGGGFCTVDERAQQELDNFAETYQAGAESALQQRYERL
jgi:hypothetical protein